MEKKGKEESKKLAEWVNLRQNKKYEKTQHYTQSEIEFSRGFFLVARNLAKSRAEDGHESSLRQKFLPLRCWCKGFDSIEVLERLKSEELIALIRMKEDPH